MNKSAKYIGLIALFALGVGSGIAADSFWRTRSAPATETKGAATAKPAAGADEEEVEPAAAVRTVAAIAGELHRTVEAFGVAALPPTATSVESWPTDVIVSRVLVQPGEMVSKDAPLMQVTITREAETQIAAAELAFDNAAKSLELAQQRLDRGLATRTDVLTAQAARDEAKQRLDRLQAGKPAQDGIMRAHSAGIIAAVRVQAGGTVPAGTPIVDIASDTVVAQIGIDPADAASITPGQVFEVRPIDDHAGGHWTGTVSLIAHALNPTSRLIDATLSLTGDPPTLPRAGIPLRAQATLAGASGVIIPRVALVPEDDGMIVYVVRDGVANHTPVTVSQRGGDQVLLAGGCKAGDHVVVSGQGQLAQGTTVREITAEPKAAQPTGGPGADR